MKLTVPKEWYAQSAKIEGDSEVGAGIPSFLRESAKTNTPSSTTAVEDAAVSTPWPNTNSFPNNPPSTICAPAQRGSGGAKPINENQLHPV